VLIPFGAILTRFGEILTPFGEVPTPFGLVPHPAPDISVREIIAGFRELLPSLREVLSRLAGLLPRLVEVVQRLAELGGGSVIAHFHANSPLFKGLTCACLVATLSDSLPAFLPARRNRFREVCHLTAVKRQPLDDTTAQTKPPEASKQAVRRWQMTVSKRAHVRENQPVTAGRCPAAGTGPRMRKGANTLSEVDMTHWPGSLRLLADIDDPRLPKIVKAA
jgi:hypothetical protein